MALLKNVNLKVAQAAYGPEFAQWIAAIRKRLEDSTVSFDQLTEVEKAAIRQAKLLPATIKDYHKALATHFHECDWNQLPAEIEAKVRKLAELWYASAETKDNELVVVYCPTFQGGGYTGTYTYWVAGEPLNPELGPMYNKDNEPCSLGNYNPEGYNYYTAAVSTVLKRMEAGLPVFAPKA